MRLIAVGFGFALLLAALFWGWESVRPSFLGTAVMAEEGGDSASAGGVSVAAPDSGWTTPLPELGYNEREGRVLFHHYCATCHGAEGHGDGFNAYNLDPRPRDLGDPEFQASRTDDDLAAVIRSGGGVAGLSTGMPPWGRTIGERGIRNIITYLRTLSPSDL